MNGDVRTMYCPKCGKVWWVTELDTPETWYIKSYSDEKIITMQPVITEDVLLKYVTSGVLEYEYHPIISDLDFVVAANVPICPDLCADDLLETFIIETKRK